MKGDIMSERIFSGRNSEKFWDAVNESQSDIIYNYGCKAQELESQRDALLEVCKNARTAFAEGKTIVELMVIIDQAILQTEK